MSNTSLFSNQYGSRTLKTLFLALITMMTAMVATAAPPIGQTIWIRSSGTNLFVSADQARGAWAPLVADRTGVATAFAISNLQDRGEIFIDPATEVYEGMLIGENSRNNDLDVNVCKEKKQTNMRASSADEAIRIIPPKKLGLEAAIEFINDDELVEITPKAIRLRKKILAQNQRPRRE